VPRNGSHTRSGGGGELTRQVTTSPKLRTYVALSGFGLLAALALGRPEPLVLALPFVAMLFAGLALAEDPTLSLEVNLERETALEGEEVGLAVRVSSDTSVEWLQVLMPIPVGLEAAGPRALRGIRLVRAEQRELTYKLMCRRRGAYLLGGCLVSAGDRFGFFVLRRWAGQRRMLRVYPRPESLRGLIKPIETQLFAGNEVSSRKGDGIEFADVRPYAAGDRIRHINWRLSTRLGELHVNELHPERNSDVVIFLDSFAEVRDAGQSTLDLAVRAAAAFAEQYLKRRDRVGLISFGGSLRWLEPSMGVVQLYKIVEALLDTEIVLSYVWTAIDVIPPHTLPAKALVIALTPLVDERSIDALFNLRSRGFDLAVVEVDPDPFVVPLEDERGRLAYRLWLLKREVIRDRFRRLGVPVARWRLGDPVDGALEGVRSFRRYARPVHA